MYVLYACLRLGSRAPSEGEVAVSQVNKSARRCAASSFKNGLLYKINNWIKSRQLYTPLCLTTVRARGADSYEAIIYKRLT